MKTATKTHLQVRIDADIKEKAKKILANIGLDASTAVNILFKQIVNKKTLPFDIRDIKETSTLSKTGECNIKEALEDVKKGRVSKAYSNTDELMKDLNS